MGFVVSEPSQIYTQGSANPWTQALHSAPLLNPSARGRPFSEADGLGVLGASVQRGWCRSDRPPEGISETTINSILYIICTLYILIAVLYY